jgi:hypothetical protein
LAQVNDLLGPGFNDMVVSTDLNTEEQNVWPKN